MESISYTMMFGQLTHRESIRDIITCLSAHQNQVYHLGIKKVVAHSTLTRANEIRDWRIYADYASHLIKLVRPLYYEDKDFYLDIENPVYALDSTTIDLCLSMFKWAKFRKVKGAVKLHTLLDLRIDIPVFIYISDGKMHDVNALDMIEFVNGGNQLIFVTDFSKWLNCKTTVSPSSPSYSVFAEITSGNIGHGIQVHLQAGPYVGPTCSAHGIPAGIIILSNEPQVLISNIGNCNTSQGVNVGHQLIYTFSISNYSELISVLSSLTIHFTIVPQQ